MDCRFGILADAANQSLEGKLNILGAFDQVLSPSFPTLYPGGVIVLRLVVTGPESDCSLPLRIVLVDADGRQIIQIEGEYRLPHVDAIEAHIDIVAPISQGIPIPLPHPGLYAFDVLIRGMSITRIPFVAVLNPIQLPLPESS